jgi:uncharacterized protein (DUF362 family)
VNLQLAVKRRFVGSSRSVDGRVIGFGDGSSRRRIATFDLIPGMKYGWPKNVLHWSGIHESILDICATVPIHFVIADGITAMEGNGPLQGNARQLGKIVLADDPVAADATCARLMGFDPLQVRHLSEGGQFLGNLHEDRITMLGEEVIVPTRPFSVLADFQYLLVRRS